MVSSRCGERNADTSQFEEREEDNEQEDPTAKYLVDMRTDDLTVVAERTHAPEGSECDSAGEYSAGVAMPRATCLAPETIGLSQAARRTVAASMRWAMVCDGDGPSGMRTGTDFLQTVAGDRLAERRDIRIAPAG